MSYLHVIYRTCELPNKEVDRPDWMDNSGHRPEWYDKEKCFLSILNELDHRDHLHVLFDGWSEEHFLTKYNKKELQTNFKHLDFDGGSDAKSYKFCLDYIKDNSEIAENDIVYLVEDDYLHKPGWKAKILDGYLNKISSYWTLFDHPDKYNDEPEPCKLFVTNESYWRSAVSTTNTIAFRKQTFLDHQEIHYKSCDEEAGMTWDHQKFIELKETYDAEVSYPIPGWATHVDDRTLSPFNNWKEINDTI